MSNRIPRSLFWGTIAFFILIAAATKLFTSSHLPDAISLNIKGQPTIGYPKARVHIVVFEEPKCSNCKIFSDTVFPKIKEHYIDTNKVTYTAIPVSFIPGSMRAAIAMLCVYNADPIYPNADLYFEYLDYIFEHQGEESTNWASEEKLIEFAEKTSPAIDLEKLKKCIDLETYRVKIEKNTDYGRKVMGGVISTPTVYVNGIEVKELSYDNLKSLIDKVLEHEGVSP